MSPNSFLTAAHDVSLEDSVFPNEIMKLCGQKSSLKLDSGRL